MAMALDPAVREVDWMLEQAMAPMRRGLREFAEAEIVVPKGPFEGLRFRIDRQPFIGLLYDEIDSGRWHRFAVTGPTQSGKSLCGYVIPALWFLFERGETVILGAPDLEMANKKWKEDIEPAIACSGYRDMIPRSGAGSRGGTFELIKFRNGASLEFMGAGGGDAQRSGSTSRVLLATEVDKYDSAGEASRESSKIDQMRHRLDAYGADRFELLECTRSIPEGAINEAIVNGTDSQIALKCPKCGMWVTPKRANFIGWQGCESVLDAMDQARVHCPACGHPWEEAERVAANRAPRLVHKGQSIEADGEVTGDLPRVDVLGFQWSCVNNIVADEAMREVARAEWNGARASDEANAEKELCQFVWAVVYQSEIEELSLLTAAHVQSRVCRRGRGIVPRGTVALSTGHDLGKWLGHWLVIAWQSDGTGHVVDYGRCDVPSDAMAVERAVVVALKAWWEQMLEGYAVEPDEDAPEGAPLERMVPGVAMIDSGFHPDAVYEFCDWARKLEGGFRRAWPVKGFGMTQFGDMRKRYVEPDRMTKGGKIGAIGKHYHMVRLQKRRAQLFEVDVDYWKAFLHARFLTPLDQAGHMTIFDGGRHEHIRFGKHLSSERQVSEFKPGKGNVVVWHAETRDNHWLDAGGYGCVGGHVLGVRIEEGGMRNAECGMRNELEERTEKREPSPAPARPVVAAAVGPGAGNRFAADGRPFLVTQR